MNMFVENLVWQSTMSGISLKDFLSSYPYPAFLLPAKPTKDIAESSLTPIFANVYFHRVFSGADAVSDPQANADWASTLSFGGNAEKLSGWLANLNEYSSTSSQIADGSGLSSSNTFSSSHKKLDHPSILELSFHLVWSTNDTKPIRLQLVKTLCHDSTWAITTVPLTPIPPIPVTPSTFDGRLGGKSGDRTSGPSISLRRPASANLRIPNFPLLPLGMTPSSLSQETGPSTSTTSKKDQTYSPRISLSDSSQKISPEVAVFSADDRANLDEGSKRSIYEEEESVSRLFDEFPFETTPLGAKNTWPTSLKTAGESHSQFQLLVRLNQSSDFCLRLQVAMMLKNPNPASVWWGPEYHLIYNAGYANMSGTKHPFLFGKGGAVAWGELWDQ